MRDTNRREGGTVSTETGMGVMQTQVEECSKPLEAGRVHRLTKCYRYSNNQDSDIGCLYTGIIGIHHPTVCPGGYNQEPSREQSKEADLLLLKMLLKSPHLSEQPV